MTDLFATAAAATNVAERTASDLIVETLVNSGNIDARS